MISTISYDPFIPGETHTYSLWLSSIPYIRCTITAITSPDAFLIIPSTFLFESYENVLIRHYKVTAKSDAKPQRYLLSWSSTGIGCEAPSQTHLYIYPTIHIYYSTQTMLTPFHSATPAKLTSNHSICVYATPVHPQIREIQWKTNSSLLVLRIHIL